MKRQATIAATAVAATLALAGSAHAGTKYYFSCVGDSKYQGNQGQDWSTTAPAASYQSGAGCGSADPGPSSGRTAGQELDFYGGGTHTGPIQALNVELHSAVISAFPHLGIDMGVRAQLVVDDEPLEPIAFRALPEASASGLTYKYTFSISRRKPAGATVAPALVEGDGPHKIELRFSSAFLDHQNIWLWGASEVPAHVEVDPERLASPRLTQG